MFGSLYQQTLSFVPFECITETCLNRCLFQIQYRNYWTTEFSKLVIFYITIYLVIVIRGFTCVRNYLVCCMVELRHEPTYDKWRMDNQYTRRGESKLLGVFQASLSWRLLPSTIPLTQLILKFTVFRLSCSENLLVVYYFNWKLCLLHALFFSSPHCYLQVKSGISILRTVFSLFPWFSLIFISLSKETNVCVTTLDNSRSFLSSCRSHIFVEHTLWSF